MKTRKLAELIYDGLNENGANLGNACVNIIEQIINDFNEVDNGCPHRHILWINSEWKYICLNCGKTGIEI